jgi:hypothetical protein
MATKRERAAIIERLAFEMAATGKYSDYMAIEFALRAQGYQEARTTTRQPQNTIFIERNL